MEKFKNIVITIILIFIVTLTVNGNDIKFAWLTDTHVGSDGAAHDLALAVKDVNSLSNIDFVIVSGDISEMDIDNNLDTAKVILDELNVKYHIIPGNHDTKWSASGCTKFKKLWGKDKFNFEYNGIRFIGLHQGPIMRMAPGFFSPEDLQWLKSELGNLKNKSQPIIFITHYPINKSVSNYLEFINIVKKYNVQFVLHGHGHANKKYDFSGIPGVMSRSTLSNSEEYGGYNIVEINSDSALFYNKIVNTNNPKKWHSLPIGKKHYDNQLQKSDFSIPINSIFHKKWSYDSGYLVAAPVKVDDDMVIFGNSSGDVTAISLSDGKLIWKFHTNAGIYTTPNVYRNSVIVTSSDSYIYCLDIQNGELNWKYKTGAAIVTSPVVFKNTIFVGGSDKKFRAINLSDGKLKWEYSGINGFIESTPLLYKDKVIFGAWDETIYALSIADGKLVWKWSGGINGKLYSPAACNPIGAYNKVFIVAPDRFITAININNGETVWRTNSFTGRESIGLSEKSRMIYIKTMQDTLVAVSTISNDLKIKWKSGLDYGYDIDPSYAVEKNGKIYFTTQKGYIYSVSSETGKLIWEQRISIGLLNTPVVTDSGDILLSGFDGKITCLNIQTK
ncbi:MAG: PQQ-binding-like beta-propeller repeat protein [Candidatus Marinimicrobia bacterium]|nr:PQQ-binding-like beta-propeller repeat protein [Candidatus Neomarinimicrobiota bacterium]